MKHKNKTLKVATIISAVLVIILEIFFPVVSDAIKYPALVSCLILIGIPHGAIDHIVTSSLFNLSNTLIDQAKFYLYYLIMMTMMILIWITDPLVGFLIFALLTVYHFGQADLEYLPLHKTTKRCLFFSRGSMIMGLILLGHPEYIEPVVTNITGVDFLTNITSSSAYAFFLFFLPIQYFVLQLLVLISANISGRSIIYASLDVLIVASLFIIVNPILAFTVYFGLWHSAGHVQEMLNYLKQTGIEMDLGTFYKKSAPLNLITFAGMGIIYWVSTIYNFQLQVVSLLFIIISVLTLPHMLIVEKMYHELQQSKI